MDSQTSPTDEAGQIEIDRRTFTAGVGGATVTGLAGCIGGDDDDDSSELLTTYTAEEEEESYQNAIEEYHNDIGEHDFEISGADWDGVFDRLTDAQRTGNWPDLAMFLENQWLALLYDDDLVADPSRLIEAGETHAGPIMDDVPETHYQTLDGEPYSVQTNNQGQMLWLRDNILEQIDEDLPESWEDELRVTEAMAENADQVGIQHATSLATSRNLYTDNVLHGRFKGAGGDLVDPELNPSLDSQYLRDTLEHWNELAEYTPDGTETWDFDDVYTNFAAGHTGACYYWGRAITNFVTQSPDDAEYINGVQYPIPDTDSARPNNRLLMTGDGAQLPEGANNPDVIEDWWEIYMKPEHIVETLMAGVPGNTCPIYENHLEPFENFEIWSELPNGEELREGIFDAANNSHPYNRESPDHELFGQSGRLAGDNIYSESASEYFQGELQVDEAVEEIQQKAEEFMDDQ
jgi:multiple sugar transport system substrate-binding protein